MRSVLKTSQNCPRTASSTCRASSSDSSRVSYSDSSRVSSSDSSRVSYSDSSRVSYSDSTRVSYSDSSRVSYSGSSNRAGSTRRTVRVETALLELSEKRVLAVELFLHNWFYFLNCLCRDSSSRTFRRAGSKSRTVLVERVLLVELSEELALKLVCDTFRTVLKPTLLTVHLKG